MTACDSFNSAIIDAIGAFNELTQQERQIVEKQLSIKSYQNGQYIISQARNDHAVYFIISGTVRVCLHSASGREIQFEDIGAGIMFGEISAIDGGSRTSDCLAVDKAVVAVLNQADFAAAINMFPSFNSYVLNRLVAMLRRHIGRVYEFSAYSVKDRIRFELLRIASRENDGSIEPRILKAPTHSDIAARISTHREAVTRELKRLEGLGIITWSPGNYVIHDITALTEER